jgi:hypothetical protein
VVVEQAVGGEGVVDPVTDGVAQLGLGHAPVQGEGGNDVDVVDAGLGRLVEHRLDDALAHVGAAHGWQGQRDVVERDGQLHARPQQAAQRLAVAQGVVERMADGALGVVEGLERLARVEHAAAARRQLLEPQALAVVEQDRGRRPIDVEDESGAGHQRAVLVERRSKAILTAPRAPACAAWSMASS